MTKTMAEAEQEAKIVKVYAPLEDSDIKLPPKRIAQLEKRYGKGYKHKFKITVKEFRGRLEGEMPTKAFTGQGEDIIYKKANVNKAILAHEEAHIVYGNHEYNALDPKQWMREEIQADLYAYNKTGELHNEVNHFRGLYYGMTQGNKDMSHTKTTTHYDAVKAIDEVVKGEGIPSQWKKDWEKVKDEIRGF